MMPVTTKSVSPGRPNTVTKSPGRSNLRTLALTPRSSIVASRPSAARTTTVGPDSALSANMSETVTPWEFSVEGESGSESDERIGAGPRWAGDRGGGEGDAAAVHARVQEEDRPGGGRL